MSEAPENTYRYLTTTPKDRTWGCYVTAAGSHVVGPGRVRFSDPSGQQLWKNGRVLGDYGLIYIAGGQGMFRSEESGEIKLREGDLFVLFPGVRHRYRPDPETGWTEYWLLLNGHQPDRLFEHEMLSPRSPVFHIGDGCPVESIFIQVVGRATGSVFDSQSHIGGAGESNTGACGERGAGLSDGGHPAPSRTFCGLGLISRITCTRTSICWHWPPNSTPTLPPSPGISGGPPA